MGLAPVGIVATGLLPTAGGAPPASLPHQLTTLGAG